ncbi:CdaR family transcriptional regulator [Streptomyces sp. NP-1717]|uniref:PucR family transcriptional regulator n=1 Tax=Streptomyces sp. NP-1717 TaxID=2704470 RepID=UPI001F5C473D|nr:PucR family transcriptional regulator [Streptomyces sp. NP-1717]MCI3222328.1 PucR family transcriptional regulator [Streptomyces sp. NP-1717]
MPHVIRSRVRAPHASPVTSPVTSPVMSSAAPRPARSPADAEAVAVLHRAAQALMDDLAGLTHRLVAALREKEPAYRAAIEADPAGIWQEANRSLRLSVGSLIRPRESREAACRMSWRIGEHRAEQGLPLDALLHAFRLGGAMVWQGLVDETTRRRPEDIRLLVHVAADVWSFVDEHCGLVADAYRATERRLAWRRENQQRLTVAALLDGTARIADIPGAATMLELPEEGRYVVVAASGASGAATGPVVGLPPGTRALRHRTPDAEHVVVLLAGGAPERADEPPYEGTCRADGELAALAAGLTVPPGVRVGIGSAVTGLAALGEARGLAATALRACPRDGGVVLLDEHLPAALVVSSSRLGAALAGRVLGPLDRLDPADRDLLVDTLRTWLEADGSAQRAGTRLYCHRNTVLNRLRRFEQLTGRSLARPSDVVEISLALAARRLLDS